MKTIVVITEFALMWEGIRPVLEDELDGVHIQVYSKHAPFQDRAMNADLILIDVGTNETQLFDWLSQISLLETKVVVWLIEIHKQMILKLFRQKLNGYFYGEMEMSELVGAMKAVLNGDQFIHPLLSPVLLEEYIQLTKGRKDRPVGVLTKQEWNVLEEITQGKTNQDIAQKLYISSYTVNNHVSSILRKLQVTDRTKAALLAVQNKWVDFN